MTAYADYFQNGANGTKYYTRDLEARQLISNLANDIDAAKADINSPAFTGTPTAPTAAVGTDTTQLATTAFVQKHAPIHLTVSVSQGTTVTKSDSRITATMRVINVVFGTPSNVASNISWLTTAGSVTFTGTFAGTTTIDFDLIECN